VLARQGWIEADFSPYLNALGYMGPLSAALIVSAVDSGLPGIKQLLGGLICFRVSWRWYAFVLLVPPLLFIAGAAIGIIPIAFISFLFIIGMILANQKESDLGRRIINNQ
jgi:hypothetical protein